MSNFLPLAIPGAMPPIPNSGAYVPAKFGFGDIYSNHDLGMFRKLIYMMRMDETERGLVLGILDNPNDATRRNIYADWLEEYGRLEEAADERAAAEYLRRPKETPREYGVVQSGGTVF